MTDIQILFALFILMFFGQLYLFRLHFEKERKRSKYQKEIDKYFENMRAYGFHDQDIADTLLHNIESYEELREANKKALKHLKTLK